MPLKIVRNDITKMQVDAIVNTANEEPVYATGVDTAVYKAAGEELLLAERQKIGFLKEGEVAITPGFALPAKYIIHAVSPLYIDGTMGDEERLRACYRDSLKLAKENNCESIAFPLISTGGFGYPKEEGMRVALDEINLFLLNNEMLVYIVVFDEYATRLGAKLYPMLESYIDSNYVEDKFDEEYDDFFRPDNCAPQIFSRAPQRSKGIIPPPPVCAVNAVHVSPMEEHELTDDEMDDLDNRLKHISDTFQEYLLYLIQAKGFTNAQVYNASLVDKKLFSKIKNNKDYHPDKFTVLRLCIGARLNFDEAKDLLARAGYAFSPCDKRDLVFRFFIENEIYDIMELEVALDHFNLPAYV